MKQDELLKLDNQLCFPLYACAKEVVNLYTPHLKPLGITYTQYLVFLLLWEKNPIPMSEICKRLYLDSGTLTPLLKKLENLNYIERIRSKEDERCILIQLTEEGKQLKKKCASIPVQVGSCINLEPKEAEVFYKLLNKVLNNES